MKTGNIRTLTRRVMDFSKEKLGMQQEDVYRGDELFILDNRFQHLSREVESSRNALEQQAESLRIERDKAQKYLDVAAVMMLVIDMSYKVKLINKKGCEILGYKEDEIIGNNWFDNYIPEKIRDEIRSTFEKSMSEGMAAAAYYESPVLIKSGEERMIAWHNTFLTNEAGNITGTLSSGEDITERKKADMQISASLKEKEVLLKEIHHRVKNNMQVITSLLNLQSGPITDEKYIDIFKESHNRIRSMALVHEKLYKSSDLAVINFRDYVKSLVNELISSYSSINGTVSLDLDINNNIHIPIDTAIPCGLIVNELVSNSLKYAFPAGTQGTIKICLDKSETKDSKTEYELIISDNGIGIPEGLDIRKTKSLGLMLVTNLAEHQLQGKLKVRGNNRTSFHVYFNELKYNKRLKKEL